MIKYDLFDDMLNQMHLLIAGAAGSGKSVIVQGMIHNALFKSPKDVQFILIDPKRVELSEYRYLPHVLRYASEPESMIDALRYTMTLTEKRYAQMQRQGLRKYQGSRVYVIIDELADLMTTNKKAVMPLIQRLCQIGRAAKISVVGCTQCPLAIVIPTPILVNFDSRVGLRTATRQHSRNILDMGGCELLPKYGQGYFMTPAGIRLYNIPMYTDSDRKALIQHWTKPKKKSIFSRFL